MTKTRVGFPPCEATGPAAVERAVVPTLERRRLLAAVFLAPALGALPGCGGLRDMPAQTHYELRDLGRQTLLSDVPGSRTLLMAWSSASAFYDSTGLAYSRQPGALAYYRFANWSERPAARIARLLQRRLAQSRLFADVAATTAAVSGDWLLDLQLEEMLHDDVSPPGVARIVAFARLVDRGTRRTIDSRRFERSEALASESAAQAAQAFDRALTGLLDEMVGWVGEQVAAARPGGIAGSRRSRGNRAG